ncbi:PaREP6 [Pyrobaculum oguniense TE7]|uniref:PaREP6 n=1 Tax=Pyrobaculum oguniense (strain DSM 13380 / JCM 10595 / TE7) TaxID=698757 RepID=H6QCJ8_PYROT|nr:PaREP6 [Pyrobaculum oguniense TE7]
MSLLDWLLEREKELREERRRAADWEYINGLPPPIRGAVELFIETGDLRLAQRLSGLSLEEFIDVLRRARVWVH